MNRQLALVGAVGVGVGLMYLIDLADRKRTVPRFPSGYFARGLSRLIPENFGRRLREHALAETVRAEVNKALRRPHAVEAEVVEGRVVLRGGVQKDEAATLLSRIQNLPGVAVVDNHLVPLDLMEDGIG